MNCEVLLMKILDNVKSINSYFKKACDWVK